MFLFIFTIIFIFGLVIGSFLNVIILRLKSGESAVKGRSKCPQCGHVLNWVDLIPVVGFFLLGRKCRYCATGISWQYPMVELATGLLFVVALIFDIKFPVSSFQFPVDFQSILILLRDWFVISALIIIFVYDLKWLIIPDKVVLPATAVVIIFNLLIGVSIGSMAIGLAVGLGFFALQYVISKGTWIGGGDLRLGALMGALLGWPAVLVALFLAYIIGAIVSVILLALKKVTPKSQVPFGVFLAPATIVALFWGERILSWYLGRM